MSHAARISDALDRAEAEAEVAILRTRIEDARAALSRAESMRQVAAFGVLSAPDGKKSARLKAYLEATNQALKAHCAFNRLLKQAGLL